MKATLVLLRLAVCGLLCAVTASGAMAEQGRPPDHFVPNSQEFWDFSKNWTTNYGPAYWDTADAMLACTGQFALCFNSGPKPLPCKMTGDGRFANCTCPVRNDTNYVLITAILNYDVYQKTIKICGTDGADCPDPDDAPVCKFLNKGKLIPGAQVISTFDLTAKDVIVNAVAGGSSKYKNCDGPFAGCMTAPCTFNKKGDTAECSCPVFWGRFQVYGDNAQCDLGGDLVPSASYNPKLDPDVP